MIIIWSGNAILLPLLAVAGAMGGLFAGDYLGMDNRYSGGLMGLGGLIGSWCYMKWLGKPVAYLDRNRKTGDVVEKAKRPALFWISVSVWGYVFMTVFGLITVANLSTLLTRNLHGGKASATSGGTGTKEERDAFAAADRLLAESGEKILHGDGSGGEELADAFGKALRAVRDKAVEAGRIYRPTLDDGDFSTYGRVTADRRLVLIAKVPGVRKYTAEVRAAMAAEAWEIAGKLGADLDPAPQRIAIGIRGEDGYWEVLEGSPGSEPTPHKRSGDALIAYFTPVLSGGSAVPAEKSE